MLLYEKGRDMELNFLPYYHWGGRLSTCAKEAQRDTLLEINLTQINIHTYTNTVTTWQKKPELESSRVILPYEKST